MAATPIAERKAALGDAEIALHCGYAELDVHGCDLADGQREQLLIFAETRCLDGQAVIARGERAQNSQACSIPRLGTNKAGLRTGERYLCLGNDSVGGISDSHT